MYTVGLCAMIVMFGLMVGLAVILIRDQSALSARQKILENRTGVELESFRDQVKTMKRTKESQQKFEDAMSTATTPTAEVKAETSSSSAEAAKEEEGGDN